MPLQWEHRETQPVAVALAQFSLALGLEQQRKVGKLRHCVLPAKGTIEKYMKRSRRQPLLATYHVGYLHEMVIHDVGKMISRKFVGTLVEHLVIKDITLHTHLPTYEVVYKYLLAWLYAKTNHILLSVGNEAVHLLLGEGERIAHLQARAGIILEIRCGIAGRLQLLRSVKGYVSLAILKQLVNILLIDSTTLTLAIRSLVATETHTLVKGDAEPTERLKDILFSSRNKTIGVGILYAKNKFAAMLTSKKIVEEGCTHSPYM